MGSEGIFRHAKSRRSVKARNKLSSPSIISATCASNKISHVWLWLLISPTKLCMLLSLSVLGARPLLQVQDSHVASQQPWPPICNGSVWRISVMNSLGETVWVKLFSLSVLWIGWMGGWIHSVSMGAVFLARTSFLTARLLLSTPTVTYHQDIIQGYRLAGVWQTCQKAPDSPETVVSSTLSVMTSKKSQKNSSGAQSPLVMHWPYRLSKYEGRFRSILTGLVFAYFDRGPNKYTGKPAGCGKPTKPMQNNWNINLVLVLPGSSRVRSALTELWRQRREPKDIKRIGWNWGVISHHATA